MSDGWLESRPGIPVTRVDLSGSRGNGPFNSTHTYLGWILHVNVGTTPVSLFTAGTSGGNPNLVTPTIQVYQDGSVVQFLPLNWQPWCQIEGNFHYGAAETAGFPDEALTDAQLDSLAYFHAESVRVMGCEHAVADQPGQRGIGTHQMGGAPWGGHACPGTIRQGQRGEIIRRAKALLNPPEDDMTPDEVRTIAQEVVKNAIDTLRQGDHHGHWTGDGADAGFNDRLTRLEQRAGIDKHGKKG